MGDRIYYYQGKAYDPKKATLLCTWEFYDEKQTLYRTENGRYFKMDSSGFNEGMNMQIFKGMTEKEAFKFMDEHPEGINTAAYDRVFGKPEEG